MNAWKSDYDFAPWAPTFFTTALAAAAAAGASCHVPQIIVVPLCGLFATGKDVLSDAAATVIEAAGIVVRRRVSWPKDW